MELSKLRTGELVAAVGGLVLLVAMFAFDWYEISGFGGLIEQFGDAVGVDTGIKAWDGQGFLGTIANLVILAAAVAAIALAIVTATSRTVALPVAASAITAGLGIGAVVMVLLRMVFQPGPNEVVGPALRHLAGADRGGDDRVRRLAEHAGGGHLLRGCARPAARRRWPASDAPPAEPVAAGGPAARRGASRARRHAGLGELQAPASPERP